MNELAEITLTSALDIGIVEEDFWNMSIGEIVRRIDSFNRVRKARLREQAQFDYNLANLIGISVGRCISDETKLPSIEEAYDGIFDAQEAQERKQKQQDDISVARFM